MKKSLPILEYRGFVGKIRINSKDNGRIYGVVAKSETPSKCIPHWGYAGDDIDEAFENFKITVDKIISREKYREEQRIWKSQTDYKSIALVYNILPKEFKNHVNAGKLDESLLKSVKGGYYEVPLYYVTKAWDYILKGSWCGMSFFIDYNEENPTEEDKREFFLENNPDRLRKQATEDNNMMKMIWKYLLNIDIDELEIDFSQFNAHMTPRVSEDEEYDHFYSVPDGLTEWIWNPIIYPDEKYIVFESVSCLMEFAADLQRKRTEFNFEDWE